MTTTVITSWKLALWGQLSTQSVDPNLGWGMKVRKAARALPVDVSRVIVVAVTPMGAQLVTERLVLRRWKAQDVPAYAALCSDPEVMRWIADGRTPTFRESQQAIESFERFWVQNGFGLFALEERLSAELIGFVGLSIPTFLPEILPAVEIGWRLARHTWGKGVGTEGAHAALAFGFSRPELKRVVSIHQLGNAASGRIMEKLGMRLERETAHPTNNRPLRVYEIHREDWERTQSLSA